MIFQGFHFGPSTQGGTYYPFLTMCCPREGRDPQETLLGVHRRTHSRSQQPLGLLLGQPHGSHCSAQGTPGTNSTEMHPLRGLPGWKGPWGFEVTAGKVQRTYSGTKCYKNGTRLKTSDQPERVEREKQCMAQTLPCLWWAQSPEPHFHG